MPIEFGSPAVDSHVSASPPPDFPTPFLSPALTDSSGSDWSLASDGSSVYSPLLSSLTALVPVGAPVGPDHPSAFPSPPLVEEAFEIKAEIDKYVDSLTAQRRHRGSGPSLVKLKCSWCEKKERRPSELKEHMYAHRGLALFPCPNKGCKHVSNRASNLTRHLHKCDRGSKE
ncbi:hypothetical protein FRC09_004885 [Ceratobasidium sp. 395]|nr:hypothetical protein FRC09_004885 [Ceratobasidium sp. 395]